MNFGKAGRVLQFAINLVFVTELRAASTMLFEFYCDLITIELAMIFLRKWHAADANIQSINPCKSSPM